MIIEVGKVGVNYSLLGGMVVMCHVLPSLRRTWLVAFARMPHMNFGPFTDFIWKKKL